MVGAHLWLTCLLLLTNLLVLLASLVRIDWRRLCARSLERARKVLRAGGADDITEARVEEEMRARRLLRGKAVISTVPVMNLFIFAPALINQIVGGTIITDEKDYIIAFCGFFLLTLLAAFPAILTARTQETFYFVMSLLIAAFVSPFGVPAQDIRGWAYLIFICKAWLAFFNLRMRSIVAASAVELVLMVCSICRSDVALQGSSTRQLALEALCSYIVFNLTMDSVRRGFAAIVRHQVEREADLSTLSAVQAVLNTICDVTVELDADLCLTKHVPQLADLLLFNHTLSLQATPITDYISSEEDREAFELGMRGGSTGSSMATAFHTRMRDTSGSNICIEIFSVPKLGLDKSLRYIVGMREFTDVPPVQRSAEEQPTFVHRRFRGRANVCAPLRGTPPVTERFPLGTAAPGADSHSPRKTTSSGQPVEGKLTVEEAKVLGLLGLAQTWKCGDHLCCVWHANLAEVVRLGNEMSGRPCIPDFLEEATWQCPRCGILDEECRIRGGRGKCMLCKDIRVVRGEGCAEAEHPPPALGPEPPPKVPDTEPPQLTRGSVVLCL